MTAYQVYKEATNPLSAEEKLANAQLTMNEIVPKPRKPGLNVMRCYKSRRSGS